MYVPPQFAEPRIETMHALMRAHPLATLVVYRASGLEANHIPLLLSPTPEPYGVLQGHIARNNPLWHELDRETEALAIFHGPHSYISPSWYPAKQEHGKVVPTWNYAVVHAHGRPRAIEDEIWIRAQIAALTTQQEAGFAVPWQISDAPAEFVDKMIEHIVGIEFVIDRLQGKWKVSQNQLAQNRAGVVRGLEAGGDTASLQMAALVAQACAD